jgi:hydroxymethylpyrimidine pyrophosphatase-like HAD family hydrolase
MAAGSVRCQVLATDYDGTLTDDGTGVAAPVLEGLRRLKSSGRRLVLVTGRLLDDLIDVFGAVDLFDRVVAENGALVYHPATREVKVLAEPPNAMFVQRLRQCGIAPLGVGKVIVATHVPHEPVVIQAIRDLNLTLDIVHNKDSLMVLPRGVDKASGFRCALDELGMSSRDALAVGDAENDDPLLCECACGVAVANALPSLKARAHMVTAAAGGMGVLEVIEAILRE